jgi:hypothetical protein
MATLAEFRAQYPQYDEVPDVKLADSLHQKFYSNIPKIDFYKNIGLNQAGEYIGKAAMIPDNENVKVVPEVSLRDRIMGVIETPLALGATLAGGAIAPIVGIAGTLASGKYGTQEGIRAGEEAMKAVQYQPRTQTAKEALGAIGEFLQPVTNALPPTLGATGTTLNALAPASMMQANVMARPAIVQATAPVRNALANVMTREQQPSMVGMGAANTAEDLMRQQRLNQFGIRATAGEREKNLAKQQFESDVQRGALPGVSEEVKAELGRQYGAFKTGQKQDILNQFERMTEEVGGTVDRTTPRAVGTVVDKTLNDIYTKKFNAYKDKYKLADESGETLEQVPYQSLLDYIATKSTTRREKLDPILNDVAELLAMNDPQKTGAISVRNLEDIYQVVGTAKDSPSSKPLKDLITQIGNGAGGKLYQEARQARAQLAKEFEDVSRVDKLLGTKAGYKDRRVALDDVYNHVVIDGSLEEMRTVTQLLKKGGSEGQQAYKELQGYTLQRMKDLLLKKGDETDNILLNNFNNFVTQLDREDKLAYMFGKTGRDTLLDLKKTISDVMVKEPGAVNYPNTAGAVLRGLEALQKLPFKIPGTKTAAEFARERQYKKQLEETLSQPNKLGSAQPSVNNLNPYRIELNNMSPGRP